MKQDFDTLVSSVFDIEAQTMCLVSTPKNIKREWRVVCHNTNIVTFSLYKEDDKLKRRNECPKRVLSFVKQAIEKYQNNTYFTLDICESEGRIYVLEVNGLSFAGLYGCDRIDLIRYLESNV
jgi:hypothetical protein